MGLGDMLWFEREGPEVVVMTLSGLDIIRTYCGWQCCFPRLTEQVNFICQ